MIGRERIVVGCPAAESNGFYSEDHESFRGAVRDFIERDVAAHYGHWKKNHHLSQDFWSQAARNGLLGLAIPEEFGGLGLKDYRYRLIFDEELAKRHLWEASLSLHLMDDLMLPVLLQGARQKQRETWLPQIASGELVSSTAMTEPAAGSDLRAIETFAQPHGDGWSISGQKAFIGMGQTAPWVLALVKTDKSRRDDSMSFFLMPKNPHITVGKPFNKIGFTGSDTTELFFDRVQASSENLIGNVGDGFKLAQSALTQLRLAIACMACVMAEQSISDIVSYSQERSLFGSKLENFQNTHFEIADMTAQARAVRAFLESTITAFNKGLCSAAEIAALKLFATGTSWHIVDRCVQLFGGIGCITDSHIARTFGSARILTVLGGSNEIMKVMVSQGLGLQGTHRKSA